MLWCEYPGAVLGIEVLQNYGCRMASGLGLTLQLVAISFGIGLIAGLGLALLRLNAPRPLAWLVGAYMTVFRGTPLLGQLFLIYYGLGSFRLFWQDVGLWWLFRDPLYCCLLAFTLNTAAYQAEIFRGALIALPRGQREAAMALGLHPVPTYLKVLLPQALITALRPLGNELIVMIKASSLASLVTLFDLMGVTKLAFARSFDLTIYLVAALLYLVLVEIIRRLWDNLERRLTRHLALA
ncbi:MAG TPA: ABC transporter permease subunit [Beijerinckiaceae bacterium]|nr:ABC transporter permease subunit [Beijerinckiaceae bacterium]